MKWTITYELEKEGKKVLKDYIAHENEERLALAKWRFYCVKMHYFGAKLKKIVGAKPVLKNDKINDIWPAIV
jgi:hypothetical protein